MRLLFLGYVVSVEEANELSGASVAGNTMQLDLLRQLRELPDVEVDVCSLLPLATYPREPRMRARSSQREISPDVISLRPGFWTLPLLKQPSQIVSLTRAASHLARKADYDYVLTFNMFPHVGVPAWWLKKRFGIPIACLLADPPIDSRIRTNPLAVAASRVFQMWTRHLLLSVDRVIALTAEAAKRFTPHAHAIAIDGAVPAQSVADHSHQRESVREKKVVFTGALTQYNGVVELIEAMNLIANPHVVLHIYGGGPLSTFVREAASRSASIFYNGKVDSSYIPGILQDAFLLVSPRQIDHPVSDVTFPSKVLQYMASGTPVLTTRLRCFSSEYEGRVFFAEKGSSEDLAACIDRVAALPAKDLETVGHAGARFVLENRTWASTAKRILDFLPQEHD